MPGLWWRCSIRRIGFTRISSNWCLRLRRRFEAAAAHDVARITEASHLLGPRYRVALLQWVAAGAQVFPGEWRPPQMCEWILRYTQQPRTEMDLADASLYWLACETARRRFLPSMCATSPATDCPMAAVSPRFCRPACHPTSKPLPRPLPRRLSRLSPTARPPCAAAPWPRPSRCSNPPAPTTAPRATSC